MIDLPIFAEMARQGAGYAVAALALWMMNRVHQERLADEQDRRRAAETWATHEREDKLALAAVVKDNTKALTELTELVRYALGDKSRRTRTPAGSRETA
jgi:hypothetical protein